LPPFDVHASLLSLPLLLGTTPETIPARTPYLAADPQLVERWKPCFAGISQFKIGICWQGNPMHRLHRHRSAPLFEFAPLAAVPGVHDGQSWVKPAQPAGFTRPNNNCKIIEQFWGV
jgi:hypothetical protein